MESSSPNRVRGDSGSHPNGPISVDGGQASMLHRYMSKDKSQEVLLISSSK